MKNNISSIRIIKFLFGLRKIAPVYTWFMIIFYGLYAILNSTIAPIFVSRLLTSIADGSASLSNSLNILLIYSLILFFSSVIAPRISIFAAYKAENKMQVKVYERILQHLSDKSLGYHADKMSGGLVSDSNKLSGSIERFWDSIIFSVVPIVVTLVSVCIALGTMFWQYSVVLFTLSIIFIVIVIKAQFKIAPLSEDATKKSSKMTAYFADVISNISTVKAFAMEKEEAKNYKQHTSNWYRASMKEMKGVVIVTGLFSLVTTTMNISAFIAAIIAVEYRIANIGIIYLVVSYTFNVVSELWEVSHATRNFIRIIGDASPMIKTLDEPIEIKDPSKPQIVNIKAGRINFENISFSYQDSNNKLFDKFSLSINPGERVGLVGRSGSGKTSLAKLLLRFSDIDKGRILIDEQDITKITQQDLHNSIAYVPQEPILFHRSLAENIAYGKPGASQKQIRWAAEQANALDFIKDLPKGLNTLVGERGIKLSGGQRQRIAIARAILKDAPIIVLDEATSALDSQTEQLIQDALSKLMAGRTSIVIAHRLSTIAKLDRIVVMDDGNIIEQGTHSQLLAENGVYADLWRRQSGGFLEE